VHDTAQRFFAATTARLDAVLVDLYGSAESDEAFRERCLDMLAPGGCLAANWADFAVNPAVRPMADAPSGVTRTRGLEPFFVARRGFCDNLGEYVPKSLGAGPDTIGGALERFALERHLPDRGRASSRTAW
jgi:hypothetical protein